jgi:hypothetical protein
VKHHFQGNLIIVSANGKYSLLTDSSKVYINGVEDNGGFKTGTRMCLLVNPKTPRLSMLHISPGRVSCILLQMHPNPICTIFST